VQDERGLELVRQVAGARTVLVLDGDLDVHSSPLVQQAVARAIDEGASEVVLDLAGIRFVDSSGIGVLIACHKRASTQHGRLVLRSPSPRVARLLAVTALDRVLAIDNGAGVG
jgi:anti-sigma B factor antagonist